MCLIDRARTQYISMRLKSLFKLVFPNLTWDKANIKKDAWLLKSFAVLVKRKSSRKVTSRSKAFNDLMKLLRVFCPSI